MFKEKLKMKMSFNAIEEHRKKKGVKPEGTYTNALLRKHHRRPLNEELLNLVFFWDLQVRFVWDLLVFFETFHCFFWDLLVLNVVFFETFSFVFFETFSFFLRPYVFFEATSRWAHLFLMSLGFWGSQHRKIPYVKSFQAFDSHGKPLCQFLKKSRKTFLFSSNLT